MKRAYLLFLSVSLLTTAVGACGLDADGTGLFGPTSGDAGGTGGHAGCPCDDGGTKGGATGSTGSAGSSGESSGGQGGKSGNGSSGAAGGAGSSGSETGGASGAGASGTSGTSGNGGGGQAGCPCPDGGSSGDGGAGGDGGSPNLCGNGAINPGEVCDGTHFGGKTCATEKGAGWTGSLICNSSCSAIDTSSCSAPPLICGNGVKEAGEDCDGADLGGATCATEMGAGYVGSLTCKGDCTIDKTACTKCGNGSIDAPEVCDTANFGGKTCATETTHVDYIGALTCNAACSSINSSACLPTTCTSGTSDTPQSVTAQGGASTSAYVHSYAEADQYSSSTPATLTLAGKTNPMQVVLSGFNGLSLVFAYSDPSPVGEDFYKVDASLVAECSGVSFMSNACETKVARDFRCTYYPAEEAGGCSGITATFTSLGKLTYYNSSTGGYSKVLASTRCK